MAPSWLSRRGFLGGAGAALAATALPRPNWAAVPSGTPLHGLSAFGDLAYPADFSHFAYASPDAPKGGTFNFSPPNWAFNQNVLTFNTLNTFVRTGDAPPRMELCFEALMARALDEPDAVYGQVAESVTVSDDGNVFTFDLRPQARWHDGTPLTADDVAFSYLLFKEKGHPSLLLPLAELAEAVAEGPHRVRLAFTGAQAPRTVLDVAQFPIISKAFFTEHPFDSSQMVPPLGSGPYRVGRVNAGQSIDYERVADHWGRDLPVNRGFFHFDRIRIEFYRDRNAGFEAFKKGNVLYRQEFTAQVWATGYDFPAFEAGHVVKRAFPHEMRPAMQAWAVNQRRRRFADPRVREALALAFDFEWTNRNLFFGAYERSHSTFERSPYKAEGLPSEAELALLERVRDTVPEAAFGEAVVQPASDGSGRDRSLLREASALLEAAGWRRPEPPSFATRMFSSLGFGEDALDPQFVVDATGERLTLEMLVRDEVFVRVYSPYVENLRAIGIDATIRMVDAAQFQSRLVAYDFDMVGIAASFAATPTRNALERFFHSRAAEVPGTRNLPGTQDPAIDALLAEAGAAKDRDGLTTALRALDRVLRARRDWIPNWHSANHRAAYWDMFGFRQPKPDYGFPVEALWWHDADKARAIGKG
ncbi:extracellular solute-binding protein [Aquibium sp. A9E412]|uniref:extracellular solute-binding protein n=1 Tax=Aquibium sp. A9E412 TaxID=2976767 RepID=UPI0025AED311|nr:extracellular solute-binding protein [Aquibium sp. A9E412]MDN2567329.1 extracellular solute-binding protein [Aquibium sp. A9E412]